MRDVREKFLTNTFQPLNLSDIREERYRELDTVDVDGRDVNIKDACIAAAKCQSQVRCFPSLDRPADRIVERGVTNHLAQPTTLESFTGSWKRSVSCLVGSMHTHARIDHQD